jgi:hypothetical protein
MKRDGKCPRCKEGEIVKITSEEFGVNINQSINLGTALGTGFIPVFGKNSYINYSCNKNCGYKEIIEVV